MEFNFIKVKEKSEEIIKDFGINSNPKLPTMEYLVGYAEVTKVFNKTLLK
ncbi:hypothetical protein WAK64_06690 [Bacillus spongiae]|uniref:Uncharacterized protein n=1 Tax=Bacillus spongiae TaxID=2683610 RepID=A0ABU8HBN3_9BACI